MAEHERCNHCGQLITEYRRQIHTGLALTLLDLAQYHNGEWVHLPSTAKANDYCLLKHWDLIEPDPKRSGYWRITVEGYDFVMGEITVPRYSYVRYGELTGHEGPHVWFEECLGVEFDADDLVDADPDDELEILS